jgi:hypothetical protein
MALSQERRRLAAVGLADGAQESALLYALATLGG